MIMQEISRFLGIVIFMNFNEHNPPHFHARYGDYEIIVNINNKEVEGKFPNRAMALVMEWYEQNKKELMEIIVWKFMFKVNDCAKYVYSIYCQRIRKSFR